MKLPGDAATCHLNTPSNVARSWTDDPGESVNLLGELGGEAFQDCDGHDSAADGIERPGHRVLAFVMTTTPLSVLSSAVASYAGRMAIENSSAALDQGDGVRVGEIRRFRFGDHQGGDCRARCRGQNHSRPELFGTDEAPVAMVGLVRQRPGMDGGSACVADRTAGDVLGVPLMAQYALEESAG